MVGNLFASASLEKSDPRALSNASTSVDPLSATGASEEAGEVDVDVELVRDRKESVVNGVLGMVIL
jgi:hypothetical protein